jgi:hypothetical protein
VILPDKWRFRTNWRGKVILQRRFRVPASFPGGWDVIWLDACVQDLKVFFEETA